jgi:hypothetical protein
VEVRDVTATAGRAGLGLALLAAGWYQASDRLLLEDQAPWLALAAAGVVVAALAAVLWLLQLRRAVSIRLAGLRARLDDLDLAGPTLEVSEALVAIDNAASRLFHRSSCALVAGRPTSAATADDHRAAGRVACEVCTDV